ncbi:MAG TPA: TonB family protein [Cryomorphaceae bacterium]|nr:TonB family protein [Cryomorphaceae bacterium]HKL39318.1 TonB family protein [Cryomorphaceae bacterium]
MDAAKTYGAEELERKYPRSMLLSLIASLLLVTAAVIYPLVADILDDRSEETIPVKAKTVINYSELKAPPPIDLEKVQPPVLEAKPKAKVIKYLPPKPKKDEEVIDEELIPTMEELSQDFIGTENVDGQDSVVMVDNEDVVIASEKPEETVEVFEFVEVMPEFIGGPEALSKYLSDNLQYPPMAKENQIQGLVFVSFVVTTSGSIEDVQLARGVHPSLDREAMRVISEMPPWKPGLQNRQKVSVRFTMPIKFILK